jgi:O-antigen biosynthesis protein
MIKNIKINQNTIQVKNGTEFEHFNQAVKNGKLSYLADKPIIGYYGAISDWFDIDMVEYCATQLPEYNFVMIGSTFGCDISRVETIPNIHFLGEIPYKELPGYYAYFDVCLIPFQIIPLTLATNPVKFYEYLSAGKTGGFNRASRTYSICRLLLFSEQ